MPIIDRCLIDCALIIISINILAITTAQGLALAIASFSARVVTADPFAFACSNRPLTH